MGAISYKPENYQQNLVENINLDVIADEVHSFQENDDEQFVENLLNLGGSSAGARPKVLINFEGEDWLIKFRSSIDPKNMSNIEYAYNLMVLDAKLDVPPAKLFPSKKSIGFFGTKRFDRRKGFPVHMHSMSGLLHADHRFPCLDYENIMRATIHLTRDSKENEKQYRNTVFNVITHNRDDHAKNFAFLIDPTRKWKVSPAYDLTFSSSSQGMHSTTCAGNGTNPGTKELLELASDFSIKKGAKIIEEVKSVVSNWSKYADKTGVSNLSKLKIDKKLQELLKN